MTPAGSAPETEGLGGATDADMLRALSSWKLAAVVGGLASNDSFEKLVDGAGEPDALPFPT